MRSCNDWQPIESPPDVLGSHSVRVVGWAPDFGFVLAQYTPFYIGHPDEAKSLWVCEGHPWGVKPSHWMRPDPPKAAR